MDLNVEFGVVVGWEVMGNGDTEGGQVVFGGKQHTSPKNTK
jgi:hypothetical protein